MRSPDVFTFTTLLDACVKAAETDELGGLAEAMAVLRDMQGAGVRANVVTFNCLIAACAKSARKHGLTMVEKGVKVLDMMAESGVQPDAISLNTLISACAEAAAGARTSKEASEALTKGLLLLRGMPKWGLRPTVISYTSLLTAGERAVRIGDTTIIQNGKSLLTRMQDAGVQADVVTYTSLLTCFASAAATGIPGDWVGRSLEVLGTMRAAGVAPTAVTALVLIDTCAKSVRALRRGSEEGRAALERLRRLFQELDHNGDGRVSVGELRVASEKRTKLGGRLRAGQPQQRLGARNGSPPPPPPPPSY